MALFHSAVPVSQHAQCLDPETDHFKWKAAIIQVIKYTCVGHLLPERSAGYRISSFPILHLCIVYIQGPLWCFFLFTTELKKCSGCSDCFGAAKLCVRLHAVEIPGYGFCNARGPSCLSRHHCLLIVCSFVTLLVWGGTAVECDYVKIIYNIIKTCT